MIKVPEVQEAPGTTSHPRKTGPGTEDSAPAGPLAGSHATKAQAIASPTVLPIVCPPVSLTDLITNVSPSGTPRTASRSFQ